jgi:hypothetical protein
MCIIIYKPRKVVMPTLEVMENCFKANPNGAGFMWKEGDVIHISKGYMTLDALMGALNNLENPKNLELVIHFRISTTGSSVPRNTHPFPLSNDVEDLRALNIICERGLAHNGILHDYAGFHNIDTDMSDTMYFCKAISGVKDRFIETIIAPHVAKGSRFVYMNGKGKTITFGMIKPKGTGIWYSNTSYLKPVVTIYNYPANYTGLNHWMGGVTKQQSILDEQREEVWQDYMKKRSARLLSAGIVEEKKENPFVEETREMHEEWIRQCNGIQKKPGEHVETDLVEDPIVEDKWKKERAERKMLSSDLADYGWGF